MNTITVGDQFEKRIFNLFSGELENGRLALNPERSKIFWKKGYYSRDRKKDIIVDISIESYVASQDSWSILTVIECKDYDGKVPVNDIEEFHSKLQQIAGANVKGILVSSKGFQEGVLNYAQSNGIGLIRILQGSNFKWVLARAATSFILNDQLEKNQANVYRGLVEETYTSNNIDFYANISDKFTHSAQQFFEFLFADCSQHALFNNILNTNRQVDNCVPLLSLAKIEDITSNILDCAGYDQLEVPIEDYCSKLEESNRLTITFSNDLGHDPLGFEILGKITFNPTIIQISRGAHSNIFSRKFTLAHELGHYFLHHQNYLRSEYYSDEDLERGVHRSVTIHEIRRMEWQANHFAASLLLPQKPFLKEFLSLLSDDDIRERGHGILFVDNQQCNLNSFYWITNKLRESFRVSRKVIEIRLKDLKLLNDSR